MPLHPLGLPSPPRVVFFGCLEQFDSFSYKNRHLVNAFEMGFHGDSRKKVATVSREPSLCSKRLASFMMGCGYLFPLSLFPPTRAYFSKEVNVFSTCWVPRNKHLKTQKPEEGGMCMQTKLDLNIHAFGLDKPPETEKRLGEFRTNNLGVTICLVYHGNNAFFVFAYFLSVSGGHACAHKQACVSMHAHGELSLTSLSTLSLRHDTLLQEPCLRLPSSKPWSHRCTATTMWHRHNTRNLNSGPQACASSYMIH